VIADLLYFSSYTVNQTKWVTFKYDCLDTFNSIIPSVAYVDVIVAIFYVIVVMLIGFFCMVISRAIGINKPNY
jgi:hypothetical protein